MSRIEGSSGRLSSSRPEGPSPASAAARPAEAAPSSSEAPRASTQDSSSFTAAGGAPAERFQGRPSTTRPDASAGREQMRNRYFADRGPLGKGGGTQQAAAAAFDPGQMVDSTRAIADRGPVGRTGSQGPGAVADRGPLGSLDPRGPDDPNRTSIA